MTEKNHLTFEEVNEHVEKHFTPEQQKMSNANKSQAEANLCSIYKTVRPILILASEAILIPAKWRAAIKILVSTLDAICPQQ